MIGPPFPEGAEYLWRWFAELDNDRGDTGDGPAPITYQDIEAWARLTGRKPRPWEVGVIKALDTAARRIAGEGASA